MEQEELWKRYESFLLNEGLTKHRIDKLRSMFISLVHNLKKPLGEVTRPDIEQFLDDLNKDKVRRIIDGKALSGATKSDIKKTLKQFYKWLSGNNEFYPPQVAWIKTKIRKDEKPKPKDIVNLEQIRKIANVMEKSRDAILTLILFDSGFRIDEALSVKKCNLTWEPYNDKKDCCWWIECNRSKTFSRKVPIPLFSDDIAQFVRSSYFESLSDQDLIWPFSYEAYLPKLRYAADKVTGLKISCHCLRHSSATLYAARFDKDLFSLCARYGWSISSNEAKTYIRMSGAHLKEAPKRIYEDQVTDLKKELRDMQERFAKIENLIIPYFENLALERKKQQEAGPGK